MICNFLILIFCTLSFGENISIPFENTTKLGNGWFQSTAWVEIHDDLTVSQARESTINNALKNIIEFNGGVKISSTSLSILSESNLEIDLDHFSHLINTMSNGLILEKEILKEEKKMVEDEFIYIITLKAKVGKLKGESDPFFKLNANLNREHYQHGDEMAIEVSSSKDCFVYLFNILSDESVSALLPNEYDQDNFLAKGQSLRVPQKNGKIKQFTVKLPEGKTQVTEMILVLGIKAIENKERNNFDLNMGNYKMALKELMEFIIGFPRDRIEQVSLNYVVTD